MEKRMDDIMNLMSSMVIDVLGGFDETQFGIFDDDEQEELMVMWKERGGDVIKFINILSPAQKYRLTMWAVDRTSYKVTDLTKALKKFTKFLESPSYSRHEIYPKTFSRRGTLGSFFKKEKNVD
jgi:hypothetical protein